jgi:hypothetical protein
MVVEEEEDGRTRANGNALARWLGQQDPQQQKGHFLTDSLPFFACTPPAQTCRSLWTTRTTPLKRHTQALLSMPTCDQPATGPTKPSLHVEHNPHK